MRLHCRVMKGTAGSSHRLRAVVYPALARSAAGLLIAISRLGLLAILAAILLSDGPVNPLRLIHLVAGVCLLPGLAALAMRRFFQGYLRIDAGTLIIEQRHRRIEIPLESLVGLKPWLLPLPESGVWLRLRSGRRWSGGVAMEDPGALIDALVDGGASPRLGDVRNHPSLIYARARSWTSRRSWRRALLDFPVFALVPTIPLFRVHQIIAYGGALGEYHLYGLGAYLSGFAIYWATLTIYLLLYAAALRVPVETIAAGSALLAPQHAPRVRRVLDRLTAVLYYAGVPIGVGLRFVPW